MAFTGTEAVETMRGINRPLEAAPVRFVLTSNKALGTGEIPVLLMATLFCAMAAALNSSMPSSNERRADRFFMVDAL